MAAPWRETVGNEGAISAELKYYQFNVNPAIPFATQFKPN